MIMKKLKENDTFEGIIDFTTSENASVNIGETSLFVYKKNTSNAFHGDKVKVEVVQRNNKFEAKVIDIIDRCRTKFVGKIHKNKRFAFVIPDSNKIPVDFYIKGGFIS